jgi:hypothetical protein
MAGHLDDVYGRPAVFWHLDELKAGDEIVVRFADASEKRFAVMTVESYDADAAPMERIFGVDFERDLNLITCDGAWNAQNKLYEKRLVVYARLIRDTTASVAPQDFTKNDGTASYSAITEVTLASGNDATQASPTPTFPITSSPGTAYAWQNRVKPAASH